MRKITFILFIAMSIGLMNAESLTVGPTTFSASDAATWSFTNGCTITNAGGKTYSTGTVGDVSYMKFSRNVQFTMTLPEGFSVSSMDVVGYDNYADVDAYISEINGAVFAETDYVFPLKSPDAIVVTKTIALETPLTGSFTFTFKGQQTVVYFVLNSSSGTTTSTEGTIQNSNLDELVNVYSIDGRLLLKEVKRSQAMNELSNGIYLFNNQKIVISKL